jgi:hypothetical protein
VIGVNGLAHPAQLAPQPRESPARLGVEASGEIEDLHICIDHSKSAARRTGDYLNCGETRRALMRQRKRRESKKGRNETPD